MKDLRSSSLKAAETLSSMVALNERKLVLDRKVETLGL